MALTNYQFKETLVMKITSVDNHLFANVGADQASLYYEVCNILANGTHYSGMTTIDLATAVKNVQSNIGGGPVTFSTVASNYGGPGLIEFKIIVDGHDIPALTVSTNLVPYTAHQWAATFQHV